MISEFFKGKSAIVTGAGSGMGRAITIKLHELGTKVYAVSNDDENLKTLQTQCPNVATITVDLADWDATRAALEPLPPVDLLVNKAGVCLVSKFQDITLEDIDLIPTVEKTVDFNHVVNTVLFLLSDAAESIVGNITPIDRGFSIA